MNVKIVTPKWNQVFFATRRKVRFSMIKAFNTSVFLKLTTIMFLVVVIIATLVGCDVAVDTDEEQQQQVVSGEELAEMSENERANENYVLTISVEETSLPQGENFKVSIELKNNRGESHEIAYDFLFWPFISGWDLLGDVVIDPPEFQSRFFEANEVLRNIGLWGEEGEEWLIGADLEPGTHELKFSATFYLNWLQENQQQIEIWSNTITLVVQ